MSNFKYLGFAYVWGAKLLGDNVSIAGQNGVSYAAGIAFWMGRDKFYTYDGIVSPLPSNVPRYVFSDINELQFQQIVAGTNEDAVMPIPVFYEPSTGKIVGLTLHPDLKEEYADDCI